MITTTSYVFPFKLPKLISINRIIQNMLMLNLLNRFECLPKYQKHPSVSKAIAVVTSGSTRRMMLARSSGTEALAFWICTWRPAFWGHPSNGPRKWVKFGQMTIRMAWLWQEILRYLEIECSVFRYGLDPRVSGMQRVWRVLASAKNSGTKN